MCKNGKYSKKELDVILKDTLNSNLPGIYLITEIATNKHYVGQTSTSIRERLEQHINNTYVDKDSTGIDMAIKKKGADKFKYETIMPLPDAQTEQLWFLEALYIEQYNSYEDGYNKTVGNHKGAYDALDLRNKHRVKLSLCKFIEKNFKLDFEYKKIFLIGNFDRKFVSYLEVQDALITTVDAYEDADFMDRFNEVLEGMENKEFDIILSNPPYGKTGCEITKNIIDNVGYEDFINMLPVDDYVRRGSKDNLYQYVDINSVKPFRGFDDADVTTHVAKILKTPNRFLSSEEFEIENFIDPQLNKFFYANKDRAHYAIDQTPTSGKKVPHEEAWDIDKTFIIGFRDMHNTHMPFSKDKIGYRWNIEKTASFDELYTCEKSTPGLIPNAPIKFDTAEEKENFAKFMYSNEGFKFCTKLWTAMNIDSGIRQLGLIKVDWTKEWTVEEILKDYGYTDKEIIEVIEDLKNFRGMDE